MDAWHLPTTPVWRGRIVRRDEARVGDRLVSQPRPSPIRPSGIVIHFVSGQSKET